MKKNMKKDILVMGFAMFAIFFGSGNLIFPPIIGLASGEQVGWTIIGLALTGILFPMMALASVGNVGYGLHDMMKHVNSWWHYLYMGLGLLVVIFGTIPRCGGVAFESGMQGIFGELPLSARIIFLAVFFAVSYYFAMNRSTVIDKVGNYLTPLLLITLLAIIVLAVVSPIDTLHSSSISTAKDSFLNGFFTGYNTGDVGTGILCAGMFIAAFREKGYRTKQEYNKMMLGIIIVGFILLFIVYAGLAYLGAQGVNYYGLDVNATFLLTDLVKNLAGYEGSCILSIAVILACLTTAIGMIATTGQWIEGWSNGKISYKMASLMITLAIFMISCLGVTNILKISGPIFMILFPMSVVLTFLGLGKKWVPNDGAWKGAVWVAFIMSLFDALNLAVTTGLLNIDISGLISVINQIPLAKQGFAWLIPTILGYIIGASVYKLKKKESIAYEVWNN
ncbi:branched-chain amino acid transport system II carrier protein [Megamonas hypermegale]|jgi:LIVCS family branched-chain amino acid:cation transporter|uniref:Branched-chain amino acid transport system carrier protein n=3 Tax=Bacteria TaxID=2 RepID=A0A239TIC0_9FIRM|nr:branched-chain amino acid transport system II carrier protein [Megamonas hypermegale]MBM6760637.1 branched-chain amino acid transport system II carrier protein [Megamonas hypermegale]OUO40588.1 branched-chain amino acid transport system II carrier protein [Megamonas hypermegale]SNU97446.1 LIV-II [Megamonas hypermegale]